MTTPTPAMIPTVPTLGQATTPLIEYCHPHEAIALGYERARRAGLRMLHREDLAELTEDADVAEAMCDDIYSVLVVL